MSRWLALVLVFLCAPLAWAQVQYVPPPPSGGGGAPSGPAGGSLSGTYPNPGIADGAIVGDDINAAHRDGTSGTPSMRTLGTGGQQAAAGNDGRFPTANEKAGLAANTPSAANPVITEAELADYATISYVDAVAQGLNPKDAVRAATTAALPAATYSNGTAGVGATLTGTSNGAFAAQDGITLTVNQSLLVKNQASSLQNGVYQLTTVGDGSNPYVLTRRADADTAADIESMYTFVQEGTTQANTGWVLTTDPPITMGTTALTYGQFSGGEVIVAGAGMVKTGTTLDVGSGGCITVGADTVAVTAGCVTVDTAQITDGTVAVGDLAFDPATQAELDAHLTDTSAAHAASAVSFTPTGTVAATNVQDALAEVASEAGAGGGSSIVLDLGDDGTDESGGVTEIATTGDTNSIFSEPSPNQLVIAVGNDWPKADLADALAANGANCTAGSKAGGTSAAGAAEDCEDVALQSELDTHSADTTAVHGIADTSTLVLTNDTRLADVRAIHSHATGCPTGVTTARLNELCRDVDDGRLWTCRTPEAGGTTTVCDAAGEWVAMNAVNTTSANAPTATDACSVGDTWLHIPTDTPEEAVLYTASDCTVDASVWIAGGNVLPLDELGGVPEIHEATGTISEQFVPTPKPLTSNPRLGICTGNRDWYADHTNHNLWLCEADSANPYNPVLYAPYFNQVCDGTGLCTTATPTSRTYTLGALSFLNMGGVASLTCPTTAYFSISGESSSTNPTNRYSVTPTEFTVTAVSARSITAMPAGQTIEIALYDDAATTAATCTIAESASTCTATGLSVTVAAGSLIATRAVCAGGTTASSGIFVMYQIRM